MKLLFILIPIFVLHVSKIDILQKEAINGKLEVAIDSEVFHNFFKPCQISKDTIVIYNTSKDFQHVTPFKLRCNKVTTIEKSKIEIDPNSMRNLKYQLVLYGSKMEKTKTVLKFYEMKANSILTLEIDNENKVKIIAKGFF